ncbi:MAG: molybdopterin-guanine dinucleotide biosynthesis protein B, partial [Desulfobaccales bacterium]
MGPANSGKTELICRLLEWFAAQGVRVAVLKHSHHLHLADAAKDTGRYRQSGGRLVALAAPGLVQITRTFPAEPPLPSILAELAPEADLILVEGYKSSDLPKLALAAAAAPLPDYPGVVAW